MFKCNIYFFGIKTQCFVGLLLSTNEVTISTDISLTLNEIFNNDAVELDMLGRSIIDDFLSDKIQYLFFNAVKQLRHFLRYRPEELTLSDSQILL